MADNQRSERQKKIDYERDRIDSTLAGAPAFWVISIIIVALGIGAIVNTFL